VLGLSLVRQGRKADALRELKRATELAPDNPRFAYVYGVARQELAPGTGTR
jgi:Flp pilus assembly protein TadD